MKRVTVDLEHANLSKRQTNNNIYSNLQKTTKKIKLKKLKIRFGNKWTNSDRLILREHSYVKLKKGFEFLTKRTLLSSSIAVPHAPPDQLSTIPTNAKVSFKRLAKTCGIKKKYGDSSSRSNCGLLNSILIEHDGDLFQNAVKSLVSKVQSASRDGECILRVLMKSLGEHFLMQLFVPIKEKSDNGLYTNFMQLSTDMNHLFLLIEEKLQRLELYHLVDHLGELEGLLNLGIVECLSLDSVLESVLYPLYGLFAAGQNHIPSVLSKSKLKTKHRQEFIEQELNYIPSSRPPIVILSDDEKTENQHKAIPSVNLNSSEPLNSSYSPPQAVDNSTADPIQIRSEDSDTGYLSGTLRKTKSNKARGEFENYIRYLIDKYLDKHTAITSQKRDKLDLVIKLAAIRYPQQYHEVRKRIRNILRNTRRNNNRLMMRTLEEFGNSGTFPCSSSATPEKLVKIGDLKNFEAQSLPPFTPFSQLQQQQPLAQKPSYPSYTSTVEEPTDSQNRASGARFKIPYQYEVLQPSPLVSLEGDLAKQFALYNYITSQKDSEGKHLCSHFFEIPASREDRLQHQHDTSKKTKEPLDLKRIGMNINKISWYSSLSDLVDDLELMLDSAIKLHQVRSFIGRDALRLKQLITSKMRDLLKEDEVVDLTAALVPSGEGNSQYYSKNKKRRQLVNFYQALENYRDANSRVLLFSFLLPPTGLQPHISQKNFPTIMEIKQSLKKNKFLGLNSLAHSILYTLYAYLSIYPPNSQAFRDSEEMAKYVQTLYKEQTGELMPITRYTPKLYVLLGKKGHYALALPTADFLSMSYQTIHQCFTTILATEQEMNLLYAQGVVKKTVPITHVIPYNEVENLIKQKLKYIKSERNGTGGGESIAKPQPCVPTATPTPTPKGSENNSSVEIHSPANKLKAYHFPTLMFRKYVLKREVCQFVHWSEKTFNALFHSLATIKPKKTEREHLRKVYGVIENTRYPFVLIEYEDIRELEYMAENFKANGLISYMFKQNSLPKGVKLGSVACDDFLQFMDSKNETYFIIRELMNRMSLNLQDMVVIMGFRVMKLDAEHGLCWIGDWEIVVQDIQKNPRYLESMVCLYNENLKLALAELGSHAHSRPAHGRMILNKFTQMNSSPKLPEKLVSNRPVPITISSGDEAKQEKRKRKAQKPSALTEADQPVSVSDLAGYLKWTKKQVETVFAKDINSSSGGDKMIPCEHVNQVLTDIKYWENNCAFELAQASKEVPSTEFLAKLWNIPSKKEGHIILEDLGRYANIPIEVLETTYQVYIYVVKSDADKRSLSLQGLDVSSYEERPLRLIEYSKIKWILDMKSKHENINLGSRPADKKIHTVVLPAKPEVELKSLSIKINKSQVDPLKIFKYTALQMLTIDYMVLTVQNKLNKVIKLKVMDTEGLKKPLKPIKVYSVCDREIVLSNHLAEFTQIAPSNLFLFLLRHGVTYYSTNSRTTQLKREFERYQEELNNQGVPRYRNLAIYPLTEVSLLLQLRKHGFFNVKLIETYNTLQRTNQAVVAVTPSSKPYKGRDRMDISLKRDVYSTEFKVHTVRDKESGKTIILKIFEDHYLFKPREPIKVYEVAGGEGEGEGRGAISLVLSNDLARFSNVPLTRLQSVLSSYTIPSYSNTSSKPDIQASFNRYFRLLLQSGVPSYMKHTVLYPVKYLSSFLKLRELGFFNEKLLDVYKMIKFSPMQQKRILLTIRPTAPQRTGTKRPNENESAVKQETKKTKIPSSPVPDRRRNEKPAPPTVQSSTCYNQWKMSEGSMKPVGILKFPNIYRLSSRSGEWLLQTELVTFLGWSYDHVHKKLKSNQLEIDNIEDLVEIMEQGAKPVSKRLFMTPKYVVQSAIEAKTKGKYISEIKKIFDKIEDENYSELESAIKLSRTANVSYSSSNLLGSTFSDTTTEAEIPSYKSAETADSEIVDFRIHTVWRNNKPIKLKLPGSSSPDKQIPEMVQIDNTSGGNTYFRTEDLASYLNIGSQELNIVFRGRRLRHNYEYAYFVRATKELQLFASLRRMGIAQHEIWFVFFACKKVSNENFERPTQPEVYVEENFKIGPHKTRLVIPMGIKERGVLPRHISAVYNIPGYEESYYLLEEVSLQTEISFNKLLRTKELVLFQKIKQDKSGKGDPLDLPFTLVRVEDLQPLSLMHNIGIPGSVSLEIYQQLRQLQDFNTWEVNDFTELCREGYRPNLLKKWMSVDKRDGLVLQHVAKIIGISPATLEKKYERSSLQFQQNSIQHLLLRAQRVSLPEEFDHLTFIPYSNLLYKDIGYLSQLLPKQITSLLSHNPVEWTYKLFPELTAERTSTETEICIKTLSFSGFTVKLISKQNLAFSNPIKLHKLPQGGNCDVVLASDLMRGFSSCSLTDIALNKLCECMGLRTSEPSLAVTRYINLQRDDLTFEDVASMLLLSYNRNLQLVMLLLSLGADPSQLLKLVTDSPPSCFPQSITVLLTRPESWLSEYLTEKSNNDNKFFDLSQEYNYYLVDVTRPVVTNVKKSASYCEILPYQLWRMSSFIVVSVKSLLDLFDSVPPRHLTKGKEKLVSPDSSEGKILVGQGYVFPEDKPQLFLAMGEVKDQYFKEHCFYRLSLILSRTLTNFPQEDLSFHTICTQVSRVKVVSLVRNNTRLVLRKYVHASRAQTQKYWASLDELLSYVTEESSTVAIRTFLSDNKLLRMTSRSDKRYNPIGFVRWAYACQLAQLIEIGCSIDVDSMLDLFFLLAKQIEKVYKLSTPVCYSLYLFLQEKPTARGSCHMSEPETSVKNSDETIDLVNPGSPITISTAVREEACKRESHGKNVEMNEIDNAMDIPGILFAEN